MAADYKEPTWPGWETEGKIGGGSFGTVYRIKRNIFGNEEYAALKVIRIPRSDSDIAELYSDGYSSESITNVFKSQMQNIVAEYSVMCKLSGSANVVNCDDVRYIQHENGIGWDIFIKMELLTPLTEVLPDRIPDETVIRLGIDMCKALEMCGRHNILHRDIKPQNILVSESGEFKLGDFGIAKTSVKTMNGTRIGTPRYMAPEVYYAQPYGNGADIYSLGLVLYWMLNEKRAPFLPLPPVELTQGADREASQRRLAGEPLPYPAHGSAELQRVVLKACAHDPRDRYQSAFELRQALQNLSFSSGNKTLTAAPDEDYPTLPIQEKLDVHQSVTFGHDDPPDGRKVALNVGQEQVIVWIPEGVQNGQVLCYPQKGAKSNVTDQRGNLYLTVNIEKEVAAPQKTTNLVRWIGAALAVFVCTLSALLLLPNNKDNDDAALAQTGETNPCAEGHVWAEATCTEGKTCVRCGETASAPLGHSWIDATYEAPQTCSVCGSTVGSKLYAPPVYINELQHEKSYGKIYYHDTKFADYETNMLPQDLNTPGHVQQPVRDGYGKEFRYGIHMDGDQLGPYYISYNIEGKYSSFSGWCVLIDYKVDSSDAKRYSKYFEIYCDGKLTFTSHTMMNGSQSQYFELDVTDVDILTVQYPPTGGPNDLAVLCDGLLYNADLQSQQQTESISGAYVSDAYSASASYYADGKTKNCNFHIPQINLPGSEIDKINAEIYDSLHPVAVKAVADIREYGYPGISAEISYQWALNGDILSVVIKNYENPTRSGGYEYSVYNISVSEGTLLSDAAVIEAAGFTRTEYIQRAKEVIGSDFWSGWSRDSEFFEERSNVENFNKQLQKTISDENIAQTIPYINRAGQLCMIGREYSLAAADSYWHDLNMIEFEYLPYYAEPAEYKP